MSTKVKGAEARIIGFLSAVGKAKRQQVAPIFRIIQVAQELFALGKLQMQFVQIIKAWAKLGGFQVRLKFLLGLQTTKEKEQMA